MSPRYYLFSAITVVVVTLVVSWWKQKKTTKEIFIVFAQVSALWVCLIGTVFLLAELFAYLGIAQSGFIVRGEKLK